MRRHDEKLFLSSFRFFYLPNGVFQELGKCCCKMKRPIKNWIKNLNRNLLFYGPLFKSAAEWPDFWRTKIILERTTYQKIHRSLDLWIDLQFTWTMNDQPLYSTCMVESSSAAIKIPTKNWTQNLYESLLFYGPCCFDATDHFIKNNSWVKDLQSFVPLPLESYICFTMLDFFIERTIKN